MGFSKVDTAEMRAVANAVEQLASDYTRQVAALFDTGRELDSIWGGDAGGTFSNLLGQDQPRFEALSRVVAQHIQLLRDDADIYDRADEDVINRLKTIR